MTISNAIIISKYCLIAALLYMSATVLYSRTENITGTVADSATKTPVSGVIVQLISPQNKVFAYTVTASDGVFSLRYNDSVGGTLLFKRMGYREYTVSVSEITSPLTVLLVAEPIQLRDIVIRAPAISLKGDTLVYNVEKYADARDRTIVDVLRKMPGVEIEESGQIKYNGRPINKFYIEGSDFLESRYGLATNNISHTDVRSVEIMENHQPVRALQGIEYSEHAGLNLRLKDDAKLRWIGVVSGGAGFTPFLYDAALFAMKIAGKFQNMETVRLNNTGWNPASQSLRYVYGETSEYANGQNMSPDYISVDDVSVPLDDKRTRFNRSAFVNTTNSLKLSNEYELKTNITYEADKLNSEYSAHTEYFDEAIPPFIETNSILSRKHDFSGQMILQTNKPELYMKNNFLADLSLKTVSSNIAGAYMLGQKTETPVYSFSYNFRLAKRINNRVLTINSQNQFNRKPHSLSVENDEKQWLQNVTTENLRSFTEASFGWIFGQWQIRNRAGLKYDCAGIDSELTGVEIDSYPVVNDSRLTVLNGYVRTDIVYENSRLRVNPYVSCAYSVYRFDDKIAKRDMSKDYIPVSPALSARYRFTARLELFANIGYAVVSPERNIFYRGLIMNNHRYSTAGYPLFETGKKRSATVSLRYRNPVSSVFANATVGYTKNGVALLSSRIFEADRIITTYYPEPNCDDNFQISGSFSKGIAYGKVRIGLDMVYSHVNAAAMSNLIAVPYESNIFSLAPKVKGTIAKWFMINYSMSVNRNIMNVKVNGAASSYTNLKQVLNMTFVPTEVLQINIGGEHYYTVFNDNTADNLVLPDVGVRWVISDKIDLNISASNLLNESVYRYSSYGTLNETINKYHIRPRNIIISMQMQF